MTKREIAVTLKRIERGKTNGYYVESLLEYYHLNLLMLRVLSYKMNPANPVDRVKARHLLNQMIAEVEKPTSNKIISKKNLKLLKPWLLRMDDYFKSLKIKPPFNTNNLLKESENIFLILNISYTKS